MIGSGRGADQFTGSGNDLLAAIWNDVYDFLVETAKTLFLTLTPSSGIRINDFDATINL